MKKTIIFVITLALVASVSYVGLLAIKAKKNDSSSVTGSGYRALVYKMKPYPTRCQPAVIKNNYKLYVGDRLRLVAHGLGINNKGQVCAEKLAEGFQVKFEKSILMLVINRPNSNSDNGLIMMNPPSKQGYTPIVGSGKNLEVDILRFVSE